MGFYALDVMSTRKLRENISKTPRKHHENPDKTYRKLRENIYKTPEKSSSQKNKINFKTKR